eukprot:5149796-Prymnesium_polylepis.1
MGQTGRRENAQRLCGEEFSAAGANVDYDAVEKGMDARDREGGPAEPKSAKAARSYMEIPWEKG